LEVYFFDESRFGTHSKIGYAWFKKRSRTRIPYKLGFKYFYVYSAVSTHGDNFSLIADGVNKEYMQVFLNEFAKTLTKHIIFVMDNAGWHNGLKIPENIKIMHLPPYSPELNPVERLWRYLKDNTLKNKVYDTLNELESVVSSFITSIPAHAIISDYNWEIV
jgi:transposase